MYQAGFLPPAPLPTQTNTFTQWPQAHAQRRGVLCMRQGPGRVDVATEKARVRLTPTPVELVEAPVRDGSVELTTPGTAPLGSPLVYAPEGGCDLSTLPVLSPCAALPTTAGAYALRDAHGVLLAVGCAPDVSARVSRHVRERGNIAGVQVWAPAGADEDELEAACEYWLLSSRDSVASTHTQAQPPPGAVGRRAVYAGVFAAFALHAMAKQAAWFMH